MTPLIFDSLEANRDLAFDRNTDELIGYGQWVYKLTKGDEVLLYTMTEDVKPFEQFFLHIPLADIRREQGLEYP